MLNNLINKLHKSPFLGVVFHTLDHCLCKELSTCQSVLDLGCGPSSPLKNCRNIKHSIGMEAFPPYIEKSKMQRIHAEYIEKRIEEVDFPKKSFDAAIMIEVLEHLRYESAMEILKKLEKWTRKKIIISCPNGFIPQKEVDENPWQKHLSSWDYEKMKKLGFKSRGQSGLKILRHEAQIETLRDSFLSTIRFRPRFFWFLISAISQIFVYYFPSVAFGLFSVKNIESKKNLNSKKANNS